MQLPWLFMPTRNWDIFLISRLIAITIQFDLNYLLTLTAASWINANELNELGLQQYFPGQNGKKMAKVTPRSPPMLTGIGMVSANPYMSKKCMRRCGLLCEGKGRTGRMTLEFRFIMHRCTKCPVHTELFGVIYDIEI